MLVGTATPHHTSTRHETSRARSSRRSKSCARSKRVANQTPIVADAAADAATGHEVFQIKGASTIATKLVMSDALPQRQYSARLAPAASATELQGPTPAARPSTAHALATISAPISARQARGAVTAVSSADATRLDTGKSALRSGLSGDEVTAQHIAQTSHMPWCLREVLRKAKRRSR